MSRKRGAYLAPALALALLLPGVGRAEDAPLWSSPMAFGPTDVAGLAARGSVVIAGGRPTMKEASRVVPGPRTPGLFRSSDLGRTWALASEPVTDSDGHVELVPITSTPDLLGMAPSGTDAYALFGTDVWRSDDDGLVWTRVGTAPGPVSVLAFLADGRPVAGLSGGGLRSSADRGVTWDALGTGLPASRVNDVLAVDGSVLLVATEAGLFRSADGGGTFAAVTSGLISAAAPAAGVTGDPGLGLFLAVTGQSNVGSLIYQSSDLGASWMLRPPAASVPVPRVSPGAFELAATSGLGGIQALYAGSLSGLFTAAFYAGGGSAPSVSAPGLAWIRSDPEPGLSTVRSLALADVEPSSGRADVVYAAVRRASPYVAGFAGEHGFASPGWYDELNGGRGCGGTNVLRDGTLFVACGRHIYRSKDGGATFSHVDDGLPYIVATAQPNDYLPLEVSVDGTLWTSGYADGLYHSNATQTAWSRVPYPGASVGILEAHPNAGNVLYASGAATNHSDRVVLWRTQTAGITWTPVLDVGQDIVSVSAGSTGSVLVTSAGGTFLSMNGGEGWARLTDLPADTTRAVLSPASPLVAWATAGSGSGRVLYRSDDGGQRWQQVGAMPSSGSLVPSPWDPDVLYTSAFAVSHDGGLTWGSFDDGLPSGYGTVQGHLVADPAHPGRLYATAGFIDSQNGPLSEWVYRAQDPAPEG